MADQQTVFPVLSRPGTKRDGTEFEGDAHVDAQWVRWQRGFPRKMGGYRLISQHFAGPCRALNIYPRDGEMLVHAFSATAIQRVALSANGFGDGIIDRTPAGLTATGFRSWTVASMWDAAGSGTPRIIAHEARNLQAIDSSAPGPVYWGDITASVPLTTATGIPQLSGGVCVVPPFLFAFGDSGRIAWSDVNLPNTFTGGESGSANITNAKVVAMRPLRSPGGSAPAALIWTLDSLYRATFTGGAAVFRFDSISDEASILSPNTIVEYDGVFYWIGTDRFLSYNGVVREVQNEFSRDWFFDHLNYAHRSKVWGIKVPRYGEIWWFYPRGNATECSHAVIYNVRENCWYDCEIGRSAGFYSQVFPYPIMAESATTATGFGLWQHEFGVDRVEGSRAYAIRSWYETSDISNVDGGPLHAGWVGLERWVRCYRVEPDFVQTGAMTLAVRGRTFARASGSDQAYAFDESTAKIDLREQRRELRLRFESNTLGGYFEAGQILASLTVGDART